MIREYVATEVTTPADQNNHSFYVHVTIDHYANSPMCTKMKYCVNNHTHSLVVCFINFSI